MRYSFVFSALTAASLVTASYLDGDDSLALSPRDHQDVDAYIQARNYDDAQFYLMPRVPEPKGTTGAGAGAPKAAAGGGGGGGAKAAKEGKASEGGMKGAGKEGKASTGEMKGAGKEGKAAGEKSGMKSAGKENKEGKEKSSMGKSEGSSRKSSSRLGLHKSSRDGSRSRSSMMDKLRRLSPGRRAKSHSSPRFKSKEEASKYLTRAGSPKPGRGSLGKATQSGEGDAETIADRSFEELHRREFHPLSDAYVIIRKRSGRGNTANTKAGMQESPPKVRSLLTEAFQLQMPRLDHSKAQTPVDAVQKKTKSPDKGHLPPPAFPAVLSPISPQPASPRMASPQSVSPRASSTHSIEEGPSNSSSSVSIPLISPIEKKVHSAPNLSRVRQPRMEMTSPTGRTKPPVYPKQPAAGRVVIPEDQILPGATPVPQRSQPTLGNIPPTQWVEPARYTKPTLENTPTRPNEIAEGWVMDKWLKQSTTYDGHAPPWP